MGARGPKGHEPTKATRELVKMMVMSGATQEQIMDALEITKPTLHKHYRRELDSGMTVANAQVAGKLFNLCMEGNPTAIIWWEKTRMGMKEAVNPLTIKLESDVEKL